LNEPLKQQLADFPFIQNYNVCLFVPSLSSCH